jgi:hypothetical protein
MTKDLKLCLGAGRTPLWKGDEEQPLASEPIGEPAEEQRAHDRACEVGTAHQPNIGIRETELRALLQGRRHGAGERHLETIKDPGYASATTTSV